LIDKGVEAGMKVSTVVDEDKEKRAFAEGFQGIRRT
jgi:hypothetical protein